MIDQKSFKDEKNKLYIVPTPIGNLKDITVRSLETLEMVEYIFCEDTRNTMKLLNHYGIKKPLLPYHEYSNDAQVAKFRQIIQEHNVAYVSDAGMPGISDPAFGLVKICEEVKVDVVILPGPTAFVLPLVRSNFSSGAFTFYGFLDPKDSKRRKQVEEIIEKKEVAIIYEAKHRFMKTLNILFDINPDINIAVGRELTKLHENYKIGTVEEIINSYEEAPKGEFVIVIDQYTIQSDATPEMLYDNYIGSGINKKEAIKKIAKELNIPKNEIYQLFLDK